MFSSHFAGPASSIGIKLKINEKMLLGKQINVQKLSDGNPKASEELIVEGLHHKMYVYNERVLCDHDLQLIGAL